MKPIPDLPAVEGHLQGLGAHVRALRARRGMTRKDLSRHSGISERYLAQLESAKANPSVALLWRIAHAMDINLLDLLRDPDGSRGPDSRLRELVRGLSPAEQREACDLLTRHFIERRGEAGRGVALIGLRGAGKTTLGERLAAAFKVPFVQLHSVIEELGGMAVGETLSLGGQKAYRRLERHALEQVLEKHPLAVVETGGSLVSEPATFSLLRRDYFTVWVHADPEDHMQRVIRQGDMRPMEGNGEAMDDLRRILAERESDYNQADCSLHTSNRSIEECVAELERVCAPHLGHGSVAFESDRAQAQPPARRSA